MVSSRINSKINYKESKNIDSNDIDYTSDIYNGTLYKKQIKFILGKPNYKYIENGIIYVNIYLVNLERIICRIGVYEIDNTKYSKYLDNDGNIDIQKLEIPILFKFSETFIKDKYFLKDDIDKEEEEEQQQEEQEEQDKDIVDERQSKTREESSLTESEKFIKKSKSQTKDVLPPLRNKQMQMLRKKKNLL